MNVREIPFKLRFILILTQAGCSSIGLNSSGELEVALTPDERIVACRAAPASDGCMSGRTGPGKRSAIRKLQIQFAEAEQQQSAAASREREAAEASATERTAAREKVVSGPRYVRRTTEIFSSYEDAATALDPQSEYIGIASNPMEHKGRPISIFANIVQVIDGTHLLVNPCFQMGDSCPAVLRLSPGSGGPRQFVDEQKIRAVAEIVDTYRYANVLGAAKTVPQLMVYGIRGM